MNSINLGPMDFEQFSKLADTLGHRVETLREYIGDNVYTMHYIRLMSNGVLTGSLKCDNRHWWAIR